MLQRIIENPNLRIEVRINQILNIINNYFQDRITILQEEITKLQNNIEGEKENSFNFRKELLKFFPKIQNDENFNNNVIEEIKQIKNINDELEFNLDENEKLLNNLGYKSIEDVKRTILEYENQIKDLKVLLKVQNHHIQKSHKKITTQKEESTNKFRMLYKDNKNILKDLEVNNEKLQESNLNNQKLTAENTYLKEYVQELQQKLNNLTQKDQESQLSLISKQKEIEQIYKTSDNLRAQLHMKCSEIKNLEKGFNQMQKQINETLLQERESMKNENNQIKQSSSEKINKYRIIIEKLNNKLELSETNIEKLEDSNKELQLKNNNMELKIQMIKNEYHRNQQLYKSKMEKSIFDLDLKYKNKICDYQSKINESKLQLMSYVGLQFPTYYNIEESFNETSFANFLKVIKEKFEKLLETEKNLRRLLSLNSNQSIEHVVSLLLLDTRNKSNII